MNCYFRDWKHLVADEIYQKISDKEHSMYFDALDEIKKICRKTVEDLNDILRKVGEFQSKILPLDQNKRKNLLFIF